MSQLLTPSAHLQNMSLPELSVLQNLVQDQQAELHNLGIQNLTPFQNLSKAGKKMKYFQGKEYLAQSAAAKMNDIWTEISHTSNKSGSFPGTLGLAGIFVESMEPTFTTKGDTMETGFFSDRKKLIHSVGAVAKVNFVPSGWNSFSGIFKGAKHGLVRFSSAAKPVKDGQPLAPGLGLKFLRDGIDSANLVAMFGVDGTPGDWNFFSKDFTTIIAGGKGTAQKVLARKFQTATDFIQVSGLSDMARYSEDGSEEAHVQQPFGLRFEPHSDVHTLFPTDLQGNPMDYVEQLESVPANATLYNVYAMNAPKQMGGEESLIGTLVLDGSLTKSSWADEKLFFRHVKADEDVKLNPSWEPYLPRNTLGGNCPFMTGQSSATWWPWWQ